MFTELMPVLQDRPLTITVVAVAGGKIKVCVVPQSQDKDGQVNSKVGYASEKEVAKIPETAIKALTTPLALTGTPEELDAELPAKLTSYAAAHQQLQNGIAKATQEIAEAVTAIEERNKAKAKNKTPVGKKESGESGESAAAKKPAPEPEANATLPLAWCAPPAAVSSNDTQAATQKDGGGQ